MRDVQQVLDAAVDERRRIVPDLWSRARRDPTRHGACSVALQAAGGRRVHLPRLAPRPARGGDSRSGLTRYARPLTGCGAAWLARLTGGQEVASSNLASPTRSEPVLDSRHRRPDHSQATRSTRTGSSSRSRSRGGAGRRRRHARIDPVLALPRHFRQTWRVTESARRVDWVTTTRGTVCDRLLAVVAVSGRSNGDWGSRGDSG